MKMELKEDDFGLKGYELRLLPYGGGGNIIVSRAGYSKEIAWRKERIRAGVSFDLPAWESLNIYQ